MKIVKERNNNRIKPLKQYNDNNGDNFKEFSTLLKERFTHNTRKKVLYTTDSKDLYKEFIKNIKRNKHQYKCRCCEQFLLKYGGLATITESGNIVSSLWGIKNVPDNFKESVRVLKEIVSNSKITGVFYTEDHTLGAKTRGGFNHLHVIPSIVSPSSDKNSHQMMSEKKQNFISLKMGLDSVRESDLETALILLKNKTLDNAEKCVEMASWLLDIKRFLLRNNSSIIKRNFLWERVAEAPPGYCGIRSSILGSLLEDIHNGDSIKEIKRKFSDKTNPVKYQRPISVPNSKTVKEAESIISKLGYRESFSRKFAKMKDITSLVWSDKDRKGKSTKSKENLFDNILEKSREITFKDDHITKISWCRFKKDILNERCKIEYLTTSKTTQYTSFITEEHKNSRPILQWDTEDFRNPISWYMYSEGSTCVEWGLPLHTFVKVKGIALIPPMLTKSRHHGKGVIFILKGAKDKYYKKNKVGSGIFPSILKSELNKIRSVIELFSKNKELSGYKNSSANGIMFKDDHSEWKNTFRITEKGVSTLYNIDRWD